MASASRRAFLVAGAAAGGGLLLGWRLDWPLELGAAEAKPMPAVFAPNAFIRIGANGHVTLIISQIEMGQGVYTSVPMLLAEELEVGLDRVKVEHAPPDDQLYGLPGFGFMVTGHSTSVPVLCEPLRRAGATARSMLVAAAARAWKVDVASCVASNGIDADADVGPGHDRSAERNQGPVASEAAPVASRVTSSMKAALASW
jgi:isoquinoline 1-oxidoreductase beta subunit